MKTPISISFSRPELWVNTARELLLRLAGVFWVKAELKLPSCGQGSMYEDLSTVSMVDSGIKTGRCRNKYNFH